MFLSISLVVNLHTLGFENVYMDVRIGFSNSILNVAGKFENLVFFIIYLHREVL